MIKYTMFFVIFFTLLMGVGQAKELPRYGVVFFTSPSCVYCVKMKKEVWVNNEIKEKMKTFGWHEINHDNNDKLAKDFKVKALPTTFLVKYRSILAKHDNIRYEQCIIIRSKVGYMSVGEVIKFIKLEEKTWPWVAN